MEPAPVRRLAVFADDPYERDHPKTAYGVIRYGRDTVVAVIDREHAGQPLPEWLGERARGIPVVATLDEALAFGPTALLIGIAPTGGKLHESQRGTIGRAIDAGLDVLSGLHTFLGDDPELGPAARRRGVEIVDYRRPPAQRATTWGRRHLPGRKVILLVGTDCSIGKMSVALELRNAARQAGLAAVFVPTGQTGQMIEGWGVAVDALVADFLAGTCERMCEQAESQGDWIFVEGQGSLDHPAYSAVTLGLIHGFTPHAMVLVHKPTRTLHDFIHDPSRPFPVQPLAPFIRIHEDVAALVAPSRVVGVALNTSGLDAADARSEIDRAAIETGLPTDDPYRFGPASFFAAIRARVETLA
jgi:uncharacterized NAD-dependent epimerase/dehydratase family protein